MHCNLQKCIVALLLLVAVCRGINFINLIILKYIPINYSYQEIIYFLIADKPTIEPADPEIEINEGDPLIITCKSSRNMKIISPINDTENGVCDLFFNINQFNENY